jgi:hypothetical protein
MNPTPNETTPPPPRRQSCDRCHSQKVRCTRPDNRKTGACDRCLRKGAQCVYSSCLPKGRPSLYRLNEVPTGPKAAGKPLTASPTPPGTTRPVTPARPDQQLGDITLESPADIDADHNGDVDMDIHGGAFALPGSMDTFADFCASWWPEDHIRDNMPPIIPCSAFHLDPALEAQPLASLESSGHFPSGSDGLSTGNSSAAGHGHTRQGSLGLDNDSVEISSMSSSSPGGRVVFTADKNGFELSIAHLSRLSTRLSQLLGSSRCFLAEALDPSRQSKNHDPALRVQLGIKAVLKSINSWLVHGSTNTDTTSSLNLGPANSFDLLHHVFSASNHLLEILRHVRASVVTCTPSPSTTACPSPPASSLSSGSHVETTTTRGPSDGSHQSHSVVHHLVLVCVTLLLNMYIAILIALQRSADVLNSSLRRRSRNLVEPNDHMDAASRAHLQLVSVVQLCVYFIKRQNQTLDTIMSSSQGPLHAPLSREHDPRQSVSSDALSDLKTEVEQRLRRLQESLQIII